jgi:hypothetical protein
MDGCYCASQGGRWPGRRDRLDSVRYSGAAGQHDADDDDEEHAKQYAGGALHTEEAEEPRLCR